MGVKPSHASSPSSPAWPSLPKPCSSSSGPHLLSCSLSLTWSREMVSWAKALLGALWGGSRVRVGASSSRVPSQRGPKPAPGWELTHRGALLGVAGGGRADGEWWWASSCPSRMSDQGLPCGDSQFPNAFAQDRPGTPFCDILPRLPWRQKGKAMGAWAGGKGAHWPSFLGSLMGSEQEARA